MNEKELYGFLTNNTVFSDNIIFTNVSKEVLCIIRNYLNSHTDISKPNIVISNANYAFYDKRFHNLLSENVISNNKREYLVCQFYKIIIIIDIMEQINLIYKSAGQELPFSFSIVNSMSKMINSLNYNTFCDRISSSEEFYTKKDLIDFCKNKNITINSMIYNRFNNTNMQQALNNLLEPNNSFNNRFFIQTNGLILPYTDSGDIFSDYLTKDLSSISGEYLKRVIRR